MKKSYKDLAIESIKNEISLIVIRSEGDLTKAAEEYTKFMAGLNSAGYGQYIDEVTSNYRFLENNPQLKEVRPALTDDLKIAMIDLNKLKNNFETMIKESEAVGLSMVEQFGGNMKMTKMIADQHAKQNIQQVTSNVITENLKKESSLNL